MSIITSTSRLKFLHCFIAILSCSTNETPGPIIREGVFETSVGDAVIEGELFLPSGDGPFPSMIIIPGSGNELRNEFEPFATILNQNGYALYIYDKRGVGNSTGSYPIETAETQTAFLSARAEDLSGILELLEFHAKIDNERIGIFGSSQGAWVNSLVYQQHNELAYIVMASGGVASTGLEGFYCGLTDDPTASIDDATSQLETYMGPIGFDPLPIIKTMSLPVLWIYGNEDRSHPARYDVDVLTTLQKPNFTIQLYQNTNHDLIDLTTNMTPPDLFNKMGQWLIENN